MHNTLAKAHIKGHMRGSVYVKPHERGNFEPLPPTHHPRAGEDGEKFLIKHPHHPSGQSTWHNPDATATFTPEGDAPREINGVAVHRWRDHPSTDEGWDYVDGVNDDLAEPKMNLPKGKYASSGVVVEEPDGRVWLVAPSNGFGGYKATFPKGTAEKGLSLQANAIKECFEESGLKVRITGLIGDFERTTSVGRFYRAVRVGGDPTHVGWETQAVHLVPKSHLYDHLNGWADHPLAEAIGAGPSPTTKGK